MTTATLNIGLDNPTNDATNSVGHTLAALRDADISVHTSGVVHSNTEPTLVAVVEADELYSKVLKISDQLGQDCIAALVQLPDGGAVGLLIGSKCEAWGEFNKDFFIQSIFLPPATDIQVCSNFTK